jgi:tetratricopeptide (TPR) repeat protein
MIGDVSMPKRCFAIILLLLVLSACAQMKSGPPRQASVQETGHIKRAPAAGDHQKIINDYKTEYAKHPQDHMLLREYVKSLEDIKAAADGALNRENYASAGKTYKVLMKNYPDFKGFAHMLSFDREHLNTKLTNCKDSLSRKGFQEYRAGDLSEAISLWQGYLAIDPNNTDIKRALNTAKIQQKNLQQTK